MDKALKFIISVVLIIIVVFEAWVTGLFNKVFSLPFGWIP